MERILRAEDEWDEALAHALRAVPRPIPVDPRLMPRQAGPDARADAMALPRFDRSTSPPARRAATLLLLYPGPHGELSIPLTVRTADLRSHAGEVSLPGGAVEETDASREAAALREAWEEVGVPPADVRLLGALDDVWIPVSNFDLRPFVGAVRRRPELVPHTAEVAAIVELPVRLLLREDGISDELIDGPGWTLRAGGYRHEGHLIWGATARSLAMFATVLRIAGVDAA